jgi:hypothetical protein
MARPTKLTVHVRERVVALISAGNSLSTALTVAGVGESTHFDWLQRDGPEYRAYAEAVQRARARVERQRAADAAVAPAQDWRSAAHRLEANAPKRWGSRERDDDELPPAA